MEFLLNYPWRLGLLTAVVSVLTASITLQQGGRVDIRDSQPGEVFENLGCLLKRQIPVELKPVASERNLWVFHRHLERFIPNSSLILIDNKSDLLRELRAGKAPIQGGTKL